MTDTLRDKIETALLVKQESITLEFIRSHTPEWDGDWHSTPTMYTIRGQGDGSYRLTYPGGFSVHDGDDEAHEVALKHKIDTIMTAIGG